MLLLLQVLEVRSAPILCLQTGFAYNNSGINLTDWCAYRISACFVAMNYQNNSYLYVPWVSGASHIVRVVSKW